MKLQQKKIYQNLIYVNMKFSSYYKMLHRDEFFDGFFSKEKAKLSENCIAHAEELYKDTLEMLCEYILTENKFALGIMLTKQNSKIAKRFFDYLTNSDTIHMNKTAILERIDNFFEEVKLDENYRRILK